MSFFKASLQTLSTQYKFDISDETIKAAETQPEKLTEIFIAIFNAAPISVPVSNNNNNASSILDRIDPLTLDPSRKKLLDSIYNIFNEYYAKNESTYSCYMLELLIHCPGKAHSETDKLNQSLISFLDSLRSSLGDQKLWKKAQELFSYIKNNSDRLDPLVTDLLHVKFRIQETNDVFVLNPFLLGAHSPVLQREIFGEMRKNQPEKGEIVLDDKNVEYADERRAKYVPLLIQLIEDIQDNKPLAKSNNIASATLQDLLTYYEAAQYYQMQVLLGPFEEEIVNRINTLPEAMECLHIACKYSSIVENTLNFKREISKKINTLLALEDFLQWNPKFHSCRIRIKKSTDLIVQVVNALLTSPYSPKCEFFIHEGKAPLKQLLNKKIHGKGIFKLNLLYQERYLNSLSNQELQDTFQKIKNLFEKLEVLELPFSIYKRILSFNLSQPLFPYLQIIKFNGSIEEPNDGNNLLRTLFPKLKICFHSTRGIYYASNLQLLFLPNDRTLTLDLSDMKDLSDDLLEMLLEELSTNAHYNSINFTEASLNLFGCKSITDKLLPLIFRMKRSFKDLNLSDTQCGDQTLKEIGSKERIVQNLNVDNCHVTTTGIDYLSKNEALRTSLITLSLSGCNITDSALEHLGVLSALKFLNLSRCQQITKHGLQAFIAARKAALASQPPTQESLIVDLSHCSSLHLEDIIDFVKHCPRINNIGLFGYKLSEQNLVDLLNNTPTLKAIGIDSISTLSPKFILELLQRPGLPVGISVKSIDFRGFVPPSNTTLAALMSKIKGLKEIYISALEFDQLVNDQRLLIQLLPLCRELKSLKFTITAPQTAYANSVSSPVDSSSPIPANVLETLESLDLSGMIYLLPIFIKYISSTCTKLKYLKLPKGFFVNDPFLIFNFNSRKDCSYETVEGLAQINLTSSPSTSSAVTHFSRLTLLSSFLEKVHCPTLEKIVMKSLIFPPVSNYCHPQLVPTLSLISDLESLTLTHAESSPKELLALLSKKNRGLKSINLSHCKNIDPETWTELFSLFPNLESVNLTDCNVNDATVQRMVECCTQLKEVVLDDNENLSDLSIRALRKCSQITILHLGGCQKLSQGHLLQLLRNSHKLKSLSVDGLQHLTDEFLYLLATACHELTFINLSRCIHLSTEALLSFLQTHPDITTIYLNRWTQLRNENFIQIIDLMLLKKMNIREIDLGGCPNLTESGLSALLKIVEQLCTLRFNGGIYASPKFLQELFAKTSKLKHLGLDSCANVDVPMISGCTQLETLSLNENPRMDPVPINKFIKSLPHLKSLDIEKIECRYLSWLSDFPDSVLFHLTEFALPNGHPVYQEFLLHQVRKKLTGLQRIYISSSHQLNEKAIVDFIKQYPTIECLELTDCPQLSSQSLQEIFSTCQQLKTVRLQAIPAIDDQTLKAIAGCSELTALTLYYARKITDEGILYLADSLKKLRHLLIEDLPLITSAPLSQLVEKNPHLKTFYLVDCPKIDDQVLVSLTQYCQCLQYLNISSCPQLTEFTWLNLVQKHQENLQFLKLNIVNQFSVNTIVSGISLCSKLTGLTIKGCPITDEMASKIVSSCVHLNELNLSECAAITDISLDHVLEHCKSLTALNIKGCTLLTNAAVVQFLLHCETLSYLGIEDIDLSEQTELPSRVQTLLVQQVNDLKNVTVRTLRFDDKNLSLHQISEFIRKCSSLTRLELYYPNIIGAELAFICVSNPDLQILDVRLCTNLNSLLVLQKIFHSKIKKVILSSSLHKDAIRLTQPYNYFFRMNTIEYYPPLELAPSAAPRTLPNMGSQSLSGQISTTIQPPPSPTVAHERNVEYLKVLAQMQAQQFRLLHGTSSMAQPTSSSSSPSPRSSGGTLSSSASLNPSDLGKRWRSSTEDEFEPMETEPMESSSTDDEETEDGRQKKKSKKQE